MSTRGQQFGHWLQFGSNTNTKNLKIYSSMEELRIPVDPGLFLLLGKITEQKVLNIQQFVQLNRMFKYIL